MNKQQLANKIWESANRMRSKIEANEYKDYILGFIFYKFLSDKEVEFLKKTVMKMMISKRMPMKIMSLLWTIVSSTSGILSPTITSFLPGWQRAAVSPWTM